eukprot:TRINITY_DN13363_c0_g1_i1.p1 TRINITY_DN13363_c0_g1~~TRINITY_DN13363_c0_g1_i1.p1  ORF type:complete len:334 (+),score=66.80 TRINITY_DN13363_c0_g1_i1:67-1068(+)
MSSKYQRVEDDVEDEGEMSRYYKGEEKHVIDTPHGPITVSVEPGCDLKKQKGQPVWLTYHDIGTNHVTCFGSFFALEECRVFKEMFCVLHVDAPGHEEGAKPLPAERKLTLDNMAEQLGYVLKHFGLHDQYCKVYGFGVGAGCSVLLKYAAFDVNQARFNGLILVNGSGSKAGWREWLWSKMLTSSLRMYGMTPRVKTALMHRMFTLEAIENNEDLTEDYSASLDAMIPSNLAQYAEAYVRREDMADDLDCITCFDVIQFAGDDNNDFYYHVKELNKMFDFGKSTFLRIDDCAMLITEEGPHHLANPIKYWLAGKGYLLSALDMRPNNHPADE